MKKVFSVLLIVSFSFSKGKAQTRSSIQFSDAEISIDGKLEEPAWREFPEYTGFHNHFPLDTGTANKQTSVKIFHNGKRLYVSAVYTDSTSKTQLGSLKRDDLSNSISFSDAFVMVIDPYNQQQNGYYFAVNMGGAQVDALIERTNDGFLINPSWNAVWNAKTTTSGNKKTVEMEIPLTALAYNPDNPQWGVQFYTHDIKANEWTTFVEIKRNFTPFDLRFTQSFEVEKLPQNNLSRFAVTPSITSSYQKNVISKQEETIVKPSLDVQYNVTSSLKLDATITPDFSQIDVDQQVTNLTRFNVFFPERRNFFLENSDLFSSLGTNGVNPFYSRRVGENSDILFGLKLSGNVGSHTRLGVLDVQTKENNSMQNYGVAVIRQKLSDAFSATGFLINRQQTNNFEFLNDYNRVSGVNLNYKSKNNKWTGLSNYAKSFTSGISGKNNFYNAGIWYNTRKTSWNAFIEKVEKNYITDVGFVPQLYNYDAENHSEIREGYTHANTSVSLMRFPRHSEKVDSYRYLYFTHDAYFDDKGTLSGSSAFFNNALWFKNLSSVYINIYQDYVNLEYGFDPLQNGNFIKPGIYNFMVSQLGYNSIDNKRFFYNVAGLYGSYYNGNRVRYYFKAGYRLLPFANLQASYEINTIDLQEFGSKTFHLARFTGEVFFSNKLSWTTYVQYNNQLNYFNVNSRLQWEYKSLSYIYLVVSDNYNKDIIRTNWGVAFKMNYRFNF